MPQLRALAANLAFYINTFVWVIVCLPVLLGPRRFALTAIKAWARTTLWLLRWTAGIRWDIRGLEHIPRKDGVMQGCIIACKHQSAWETFALLPYLDDPIYILKAELTRIPLFGWYLARANMISVERAKSAQALRAMTHQARAAMAAGRQLIIFPEGTRQSVDASPDYKSGVTHLYKQLQVPILPAGLNAGLFWPRRRFARYPGLLVVSLLPAIPAGEDAATVRAALEARIEAETNSLVAQARAANPQLPS